MREALRVGRALREGELWCIRGWQNDQGRRPRKKCRVLVRRSRGFQDGGLHRQGIDIRFMKVRYVETHLRGLFLADAEMQRPVRADDIVHAAASCLKHVVQSI